MGSRHEQDLDMPALVEYFRWWYIDEVSRTRRRTVSHMTAPVAGGLYPGALPDTRTRIVRAASAATNAGQFFRAGRATKRTF